ncbi:MurR/RpiR family transcriptional regulator [Aquamicrobium terrae]
MLTETGGHMAEAVTYILAHPDDVAVYSMRELARQAGLPPVTFVRLAQRLGFDGYSELRRQYVDVVLQRGTGENPATRRNIISAKAIVAASRAEKGMGPFVDAFFAAEHEVLRLTLSGLDAGLVARVADIIAGANNVYVIGRRTSFPPAFTLAYALRKARKGVKLLDDVAGAPEGPLDDAGPGDVLVAFTFAPFSHTTDALTRRAAGAQVEIIAVSDSTAAPLRDLAGDMFFLAPTFSRAFPESAGGAVAIANLFVALTVAKLGAAAEKRIKQNEQFLVKSGDYVNAGLRSRRRSGGSPKT